MIRTIRGRRLPLTALGLVVAAGTAFAVVGPAQAATGPAPLDGASAAAAAVQITAPKVRDYGYSLGQHPSFHGVISVDLDDIVDRSGLRY